MSEVEYINNVLIPFVEAVKNGKATKRFYAGWANAIMEYKDKDLTPKGPIVPPEGTR